GKSVVTRASAAGVASAAPTPWSARAPTSMPSDWARPASNEASAKSAVPTRNSRHRPKRSATRPPSRSSPPKVSMYAFTTQARPACENPRSSLIEGRARFTTVSSRKTMNCAAASTARANQRCRGAAATLLSTGAPWAALGRASTDDTAARFGEVGRGGTPAASALSRGAGGSSSTSCLWRRRCGWMGVCRGLDGDAGDVAVEPAREVPGLLPEELQHGRQQDHADDEGVEEDRARQPDPEQLQDVVAVGGEGGKDDDHHRCGGGDHAARAGDPVADGHRSVARRLPLLADAGDGEDLVVHRRPQDDREQEHGQERLDRGLVDAEEPGQPAAFEDRLDDPERRRDREQVHQRGLQRNQ